MVEVPRAVGFIQPGVESAHGGIGYSSTPYIVGKIEDSYISKNRRCLCLEPGLSRLNQRLQFVQEARVPHDPCKG